MELQAAARGRVAHSQGPVARTPERWERSDAAEIQRDMRVEEDMFLHLPPESQTQILVIVRMVCTDSTRR